MDTVLRLQVYIICISILLIILIKAINELDNDNLPNRIFSMIICFTLCVLITEAFTWAFDGKPGVDNRNIITISNMLEQILILIPGILWMVYADYLIYNKYNRAKNLIIFSSVIFIYFSFLSVTAPFNGLLFYIDKLNRYHRGCLYCQSQCICCMFFIYVLIILFLNRKRVPRKTFIPLLLFPVPIFIGMALQVLFYGLSSAWSGVSISILIIYIYIQSQKNSEDYLTGLYNRRQLDSYLENVIKSSKSYKIIAILMIDVDKFKAINDTWGHDMGDRALKHCALILRKCFHHKDFIARYAGDEFIVVLELKSRDDIQKVIKRLKDTVNSMRNFDNVPYELNFSIGYALFPYDGEEASQIIKMADKRMYMEKNKTRTSA